MAREEGDPVSDPVRPELVEAYQRRGRWGYYNDEGNWKGSMRHDQAEERAVQDGLETDGRGSVLHPMHGVGLVPPSPLTRRATQYVKRLRRFGQKERAAKRRKS